MSDPNSTSNVKIYDRPEKKGPNPMALVLGLLIVLVLAFGVYRVMHSSGSNSDSISTPTTNARTAPAGKSANNNNP